MTYFEKSMLWLFCRSKFEARTLIREYRFCMSGGGALDKRLCWRLRLGYVVMLGFVRQPVLYIVVLPLSLFLYGSTLISFL